MNRSISSLGREFNVPWGFGQIRTAASYALHRVCSNRPQANTFQRSRCFLTRWVDQPVALVVSEDERVERPRPDRVAANHELLRLNAKKPRSISSRRRKEDLNQDDLSDQTASYSPTRLDQGL
jgi:hypothetical protein